MKTFINTKFRIIFLLLALTCLTGFSNSRNSRLDDDQYRTTVIFPANFAVGDYIEFVGVNPISAGASGYYEISIAYVRGNLAAAATHIASISHANQNVWREVGRVNSNPYVGSGISFTIDCNTAYGSPSFRVRAVRVLGVTNEPIGVEIKVRSINMNSSYVPKSNVGNDLSVNTKLPMTAEWNLYVGDLFGGNGASVAIKAISNGNVGIGTDNPSEKLSVNGTIRSREIKVEAGAWPDYVFDPKYTLPSLSETAKFINVEGHLPEIPSAKEVASDGLQLGDISAKLLKKIEEMTLYIIEQDGKQKAQATEIEELKKAMALLNKRLDNPKR